MKADPDINPHYMLEQVIRILDKDYKIVEVKKYDTGKITIEIVPVGANYCMLCRRSDI